MKRIFIYLILSYLILVTCTFGEESSATKAYIDPGFELCLKLYPRNKEILNPMVPRISAQTALKLSLEGKALFFAAGSANEPLIPGAINITGPMLENPPIEFLRAHGDKMAIIYCA